MTNQSHVCGVFVDHCGLSSLMTLCFAGVLNGLASRPLPCGRYSTGLLLADLDTLVMFLTQSGSAVDAASSQDAASAKAVATSATLTAQPPATSTALFLFSRVATALVASAVRVFASATSSDRPPIPTARFQMLWQVRCQEGVFCGEGGESCRERNMFVERFLASHTRLSEIILVLCCQVVAPLVLLCQKPSSSAPTLPLVPTDVVLSCLMWLGRAGAHVRWLFQ
jgi:hypothetical protein